MMLRCAIVDDERLAREGLAILLSKCTGVQVKVVGYCANVGAAVELVQQQQVDLIFLDINMPVQSGFELFERVSPSDLPFVVFVTAYAEYAVQGFDAEAVDYLLKPVSQSRLDESLHRVSTRIMQRSAAKQADASIFVSDGQRRVKLNVNDVICIQAAGDYMCVSTKNDDFVSRSTLKGLLADLSAHRFIRIHRSAAVNLNHVREIAPLGHCRYRLTMVNGTVLHSSKRHRAAVRRACSDTAK